MAFKARTFAWGRRSSLLSQRCIPRRKAATKRLEGHLAQCCSVSELTIRLLHDVQNKIEIWAYQQGLTHSDLLPTFGSWASHVFWSIKLPMFLGSFRHWTLAWRETSEQVSEKNEHYFYPIFPGIFYLSFWIGFLGGWNIPMNHTLRSVDFPGLWECGIGCHSLWPVTVGGTWDEGRTTRLYEGGGSPQSHAWYPKIPTIFFQWMDRNGRKNIILCPKVILESSNWPPTSPIHVYYTSFFPILVGCGSAPFFSHEKKPAVCGQVGIFFSLSGWRNPVNSPADMVNIPWFTKVLYIQPVGGNGISGCHQQYVWIC